MEENLKKNCRGIVTNFVFYQPGMEGQTRLVDITEHYLKLRMVFSDVPDGEEYLATMGELADHLCCTMRNMNLIMNKLTEHGWVSWNPQRGRGKRSVLLFHLSLLEAASIRFDQLMHGNKLEEAYELASSLPLAIQDIVMQRMEQHFGLRSSQGTLGRIDTLRIPQESPFETLDPTKAGMWGEAGIIGEIYDRLVGYNAERHCCEPNLAIAWESNEEGTEWTFYLHKGVRFHHGRGLEAEDVKFTFERILSDEANPCNRLFGCIVAIEAFDELTVRFILHRPHFMFPDLMSSLHASILPRDVEQEPLSPIGTGPYRLLRNDAQMLVLEVNSLYFKGRAYIDRVEVWQLPKEKLMDSAIRRDLFPDGQMHAVQHEVQGGVFMTFNMRKKGPQEDYRFRRAIRELMNQQLMMNELESRDTRAAYSLIRGRVKGQQSDEDQQCWEREGRSLDRAAAWLRQSTYAGETVSVWVEEGEKMESDMVWFVRRCERIGLKVVIVPGHSVSAVYRHDFQEHDLIYTGEVFDANISLSLLIMYTFRNTLFLIAMDDDRRALLEQQCRHIVGIRDENTRMQSWTLLEDRLMEEALLLPMYSFREEHAHHTSLRDYRVVGYGMPDLRRLWVKRSPDTENSQPSYPAYIPLW